MVCQTRKHNMSNKVQWWDDSERKGGEKGVGKRGREKGWGEGVGRRGREKGGREDWGIRQQLQL